MIGTLPASLLVAVLAACGTPEPGPEPVAAEEAPAPATEPAPSAPAAPVPAASGVRVLHHRVAKGKKTPEHVSATWVDAGLQVMITGMQASCAPPPSFSVVSAAGVLRLVEEAPDAPARCTGSHTMMLQIDGLDARDLKVEVQGHDGRSFGATEIAATDH